MTIFSDKQIMQDSEFDIEHTEVYSVDRIEGGITNISFYDKNGDNTEAELRTPMSKHNDYVKRFRDKLNLVGQDDGTTLPKIKTFTERVEDDHVSNAIKNIHNIKTTAMKKLLDTKEK